MTFHMTKPKKKKVKSDRPIKLNPVKKKPVQSSLMDFFDKWRARLK